LKFEVMEHPDCVCASTLLMAPAPASAPAPIADLAMKSLRVKSAISSPWDRTEATGVPAENRVFTIKRA
jgi:hypothetical protein